MQQSLDNTRQQVEQSLKSTRAEVDTRLANVSATDKAARLALSAVALRQAVMSGHAYQAELKQAQALGADEKQLGPLVQFAASGLPTKADLGKELQTLLPALTKAAGTPQAPAGFLARLEANAGKIVRVSPVNAPHGDKPADVLARLEVDAAHDDIAAALADLNRLPAPARAPAQDWIAKVKGRQSALAAARNFAASTAQALGQTPGAPAPAAGGK